MLHRLPPLFVLCTWSCVSPPPPPLPGTGTLWGFVSLKPREGVTPGSKTSTVYGDRRLRDVEYVDYGKPGFAVVYLEGNDSPRGAFTLALERSLLGHARLLPSEGAIGVGGRVTVKNRDSQPHPFSCPRAGWARRIDAGGEFSFEVEAAGPVSIFVLGLADAEARIFASPGPFAVASPDGRWELPGLRPGPGRLAAWHPRFPSAGRSVNVVEGDATRIDFELGVENLSQD